MADKIIIPGGLPNQFPPLTGVEDGDPNTAGVTGENTVSGGLQMGAGVQGISASFGVIGQLRGVGTGGETSPVASAGVWGRGGVNGDGVFGNSLNHAGGVGDSTNFDGVFGRAHQPDRAGVSGHNTAGGLAGFFEGDLVVTKDANFGGDVRVAGTVSVQGDVIGKALRPMQAGQGLIPILIALQ
jgi:hypothetical protein